MEPYVPRKLCAIVSEDQMMKYNHASHSMYVTIEITELVIHLMRLRPQLSCLPTKAYGSYSSLFECIYLSDVLSRYSDRHYQRQPRQEQHANWVIRSIICPLCDHTLFSLRRV